jgi:hypothetical protein
MEAVRLSHQLLAAAGSPTTSYEPGEVIFREGDKAGMWSSPARSKSNYKAL